MTAIAVRHCKDSPPHLTPCKLTGLRTAYLLKQKIHKHNSLNMHRSLSLAQPCNVDK